MFFLLALSESVSWHFWLTTWKSGHSRFQLLRDIGELSVRNERDALSYAEFGEISFGEYDLRLVSDAEIGAAIADIHPRPNGSAHAAAFAHTGG